MKIIKEESLSDFRFWSGARDTVRFLTEDELETVEGILSDEYPDGMDATELNDFFWFEDDTIAEWLGYESFEELMNRYNEEEEEEEVLEDLTEYVPFNDEVE